MRSDFWVDVVTLISIVNPVAAIPLYLSVTARLTPATRGRVLFRAVIIALVILLIFLAFGEIALAALGVGLDAFRIAGGLVLLLIGLRMIFADDAASQHAADENPAGRDVAVFPLAMPVLAGPGAMLAVVLLTQNDLHDVRQQVGTALALCLVLAVNFVVLKAAGTIQRVLGETGISVMSRVTGLILSALAVQTMLTGIKGALLV